LVPQGRHAGKPNLPLSRPCIIIGASSKSHFNLVSPTISKIHAALVETDVGVYIRDLASRTHVVVNGKQVPEAVLKDGDSVVLGAFSFSFRHRGASPSSLPKAAPNAEIAVSGESIPIPFERRTLLIGRRPGCEIHLLEASVSNCHALIFEKNGARWIRDLHSRTGTFVNGKAVHQQQLELDDEIRIGETDLRYTAAAATADHMDELEDLVGTAKLASDDDVALPEPDDLGRPELGADEPALPLARSTADVHAAAEKKQPAASRKVPDTIVSAAVPPLLPPVKPAPAPLLPPVEPDEYELAPVAPPPSVVKRVPPASIPIPLAPPAPKESSADVGVPVHITSEAEVDFPTDVIPVTPVPAEEHPLPAEAHPVPAETADELEIDLVSAAKEETDQTFELDPGHPDSAHLISSAEELPFAEIDLAVPETSSAGSVALDPFEVETEVTHDDLVTEELPHEAIVPEDVAGEAAVHEETVHVETVPDAPAPEESIAELDIPFASEVVDSAFDDLITDALHPTTPLAESVSEEAVQEEPAHVELAQAALPHDAALPEYADTEAPAHEETVRVETVSDAPAFEESVGELDIPFASEVVDVDPAFDELITDALQPAPPPLEVEMVLQETGPAGGDIESWQPPTDEIHPAISESDNLTPQAIHSQGPPDESHHERRGEQGGQSNEFASLETESLVLPAANAGADLLIADALQPEIASEPAPDDAELSHLDLQPVAMPAADEDFDALIAEALQSQTELEPLEAADNLSELGELASEEPYPTAPAELPPQDERELVITSSPLEPAPAVIDQTRPPAVDLPPDSPAPDLFADEEEQTPATLTTAQDVFGQDAALSATPAPPAKGPGFSVFDEHSAADAAGANVAASSQVSTWADTELGSEGGAAEAPQRGEEDSFADVLEEAPPSASIDDHALAAALEQELSGESGEPLPPPVAEPIAPEADAPTLESIAPTLEGPLTPTDERAASKLSFKDRVFSLFGRKKASPASSQEAFDTEPATLASRLDEIAPGIDVALPDDGTSPMPAADLDFEDPSPTHSLASPSGEVIEPTDPTPESAQTLAAELAASLESSGASEVIESPSLTDSTFARAVTEFSDPSPEPLVESQPQTPSTAEPSEASIAAELTKFDVDDIAADVSPAPRVPAHKDSAAGEPELHATTSGATEETVLSDDEVNAILSAELSDSDSSTNGIEAAAGETVADEMHGSSDNGLPPVVAPVPGILPVSLSPTVASASAAEEVDAGVAPPPGRRFSFWPFGRKRPGNAPPEGAEDDGSGSLAAGGLESGTDDSGIDATPFDSDISVTSSSTIDLAPAPESNLSGSSSSLAPASDVGEFLDDLAPADLLDAAPAHDDSSDSAAGSLEAVNFEPADFGASGGAPSATQNWDAFGGDDGLEMEPLSNGTAAAVAPLAPERDIVTDEAFEHPVAMDEVVSDLPEASEALEIAVEEPLPEVYEPAALHVAPEPAAPAAAAEELQSPLAAEFLIDDVDLSIETHLPESPAGEIALAEPSPPTRDLPAADVDLPEDISLPLAPAPAAEIEPSPAGFEPTEDRPPSFSESAAAADQPLIAAPDVSEMAAGHFQSVEDIAIPIAPSRPTMAETEPFLVTDLAPAGTQVVDVPPLAPALTEPIAFTAEPMAPLEVVSDQPATQPLPWDEIDLELPGPPLLPALDDSLSDALLPLDFDAAHAPPLAIDDAELASVAAAAREILADATPSPMPRAMQRPPIQKKPKPPSAPVQAPTAKSIAAALDKPIAELEFASDAAAVETPVPQATDSVISFEPEAVSPASVSLPLPPSDLPPLVEPFKAMLRLPDVAPPPVVPQADLPKVPRPQPPAPTQSIPAQPAPPPRSVPTPPQAGLPKAAQPQQPPPAPTQSAPPQPVLPPPSVPTPPRIDPFLGMGRDLETFLGGMPLDLSAPAAPRATSVFAPAPESLEPAAPAPEVAADIVTSADADASPGLDSEESLSDILASEEPREELFESTPESLDSLPDDSMGPISDVVEVLGESSHAPEVLKPPGAPAPAPTAPSSLPVASAAAASGRSGEQIPPRKPLVHMPPRPRLANRSLATSPFDFGSQPGTDIAIPPFRGGSITSGENATGLAAGSTSPENDADTFADRDSEGELIVPPLDPAQPGLGTLASLSAPPEAPGARVRPDNEIPRRPRGVGVAALEARGARAQPSLPALPVPPRRSGLSPSPRFDGLPPMPAPAPVNLHLRVLLPIIVALALATAVAIWFFCHVSGSAEGRLGFDNLENLQPSDKRSFELAEQQLLRRPDVHNFALALFKDHNPPQFSDGFLGSDATAQREYDAIVSGAAFAPNSKNLVLTASGADPKGDAKRLAAMIVNLYAENKRLSDQAASKKQAYVQTDQAITAAMAEIKALTAKVDEERAAAGQLPSAEQALAQINAQHDVVWKKWTAAASQLHAAQAAADSLDAPAPGSATPTPGTSQPSSDNAELDPQIKALSDQLASATASLAQSRGAHSAAADAANKALDQALADFRASVDQAQGSLKDGSQLGSYLAAAQDAQDTIHQINADLVERQQKAQQRLTELRRVVAEKQEARLKAAWAADTQLQEMDQDLSVAEHRYGAAVGSGLDADAAALKNEADALKIKIDARRDLIGTSDIYADEVKQLQQFVDDSLKDMQAERALADARMGDMLKKLSAKAPSPEKLPADQQALEQSLKKQLDGINNARQMQAQAIAQTNPEADASVRKLEGSIAEFQAKIGARRKELADGSHKQLTAQQVQDRVAKAAAAKAALTAAQMEEADGLQSYQTIELQAGAAARKVDELRARSAGFKDDNDQLAKLTTELPSLQARAQELLIAWQHLPIPEDPERDGDGGGARVTEIHDLRLQWILLSTLGYAIVTAGMLAAWGVSHRRQHQFLTRPAVGDESDDDETESSAHLDVLEDRSPSST
jgi:pSer/pThr/pTyr-binding forkhead associated (FHA) protein